MNTGGRIISSIKTSNGKVDYDARKYILKNAGFKFGDSSTPLTDEEFKLLQNQKKGGDKKGKEKKENTKKEKKIKKNIDQIEGEEEEEQLEIVGVYSDHIHQQQLDESYYLGDSEITSNKILSSPPSMNDSFFGDGDEGLMVTEETENTTKNKEEEIEEEIVKKIQKVNHEILDAQKAAKFLQNYPDQYNQSNISNYIISGGESQTQVEKLLGTAILRAQAIIEEHKKLEILVASLRQELKNRKKISPDVFTQSIFTFDKNVHCNFLGKNPTCCICLVELVDYDKINFLSCGHVYHDNCLDVWFKTSGKVSCPSCRRSLPKTSI